MKSFSQTPAQRHKIALGAVIKRLEYARTVLPSEPSAVTRDQLREINRVLLETVSSLAGEYHAVEG